jgi:hypothetical protein
MDLGQKVKVGFGDAAFRRGGVPMGQIGIWTTYQGIQGVMIHECETDVFFPFDLLDRVEAIDE